MHSSCVLLFASLCLASALELSSHHKHSTGKHQHKKRHTINGFSEGDMVEVTGSTTSSGKRGMLEEFDEGRDKWLVRFVDGKGIYFRQSLLKEAPKHKVTKQQQRAIDEEIENVDKEFVPKGVKDEIRKKHAPVDDDDDDEKYWGGKNDANDAEAEGKTVKFRDSSIERVSHKTLISSKSSKKSQEEEGSTKKHSDIMTKIEKEDKGEHTALKDQVMSGFRQVVKTKKKKTKKVSKGDHKALKESVMSGFRQVEKKEEKKEQPKKENKPNAAAEGGLGYYLAPLYKQAAREEGLQEKVPGWPLLFKYPRSWIKKVEAIPVSKHPSTFNFIGSFYKNAATKNARGWVIDFANRRFSDNDFFRITGPLDNHQALGAFDHTFDKTEASYPYKSFLDPNYVAPFDENYFSAMKNSKFTLCPAGDGPWSIRFFEAMLVGSIPIVEKEKHIIGMEGPKMSKALKWKYYLLSDDPNHQYEYRPDWVKENKEKFMKYFTFIHGNNKFSARELAAADRPNNLF